jgi:cupin superfamily acireductone dioxygenase involved in methionine salvage
MAEIDGARIIRRQGRPLTREEAEQQLSSEGLNPEAWQNGPDYTYLGHQHSYTKVLYCVVGSIAFSVRDADGQFHEIALEPGDRLELDRGVFHSASAGPNGVICVEAPRSDGGAF